MPSRWAKLASLYTTTAVVLLNTAILFLVVNVVIGIGYPVLSALRHTSAVRAVEADSLLYRKVLPGLSADQIVRLLNESVVPYRFDPVTLYREAPRTGDFVNVDVAGFRHVENQGPWPPDSSSTNILTFGGSTLFGSGVPDARSIPSALQRALTAGNCGNRTRVYNFGQSGFLSTQERALFEGLLLAGVRPDVVIFLNGINDAAHLPDSVHQIARDIDRFVRGLEATRPTRASFAPILANLPVLRAARSIVGVLAPQAKNVATLYPPSDPRLVESVAERWLGNKALIEATASTYQIATVFVWQPAPAWQYDVQYHPFHDAAWDEIAPVYRHMAARRDAGQLADVLWLADMQKGRRDSLYVDAVHYTAAFSEEIADSLAATLRRRGLVCPARAAQ